MSRRISIFMFTSTHVLSDAELPKISLNSSKIIIINKQINHFRLNSQRNAVTLLDSTDIGRHHHYLNSREWMFAVNLWRRQSYIFLKADMQTQCKCERDDKKARPDEFSSIPILNFEWDK